MKTGHDLFAGRAMDTLVGDTAFPVTKKEVFFTQRLEASSLQSIGAHVSDPALHFTFVLRRPGTTRNDMHAVVATKVSQLRIDFRIKQVGLEHSRFKVVQIQQQGHPAKAAQPVFQTPQEGLGILATNRFAVALTRIAQDKRKTQLRRVLPCRVIDRCSQAEIQREFFPPADIPGAKPYRGGSIAACARSVLRIDRNR